MVASNDSFDGVHNRPWLDMETYWEDTWGNPLPPNAVQLPPPLLGVADMMDIDDKMEENFTSNGDLLPNKPLINSALIGVPRKLLLVRADYIRIYDFIDEVYAQHKRGDHLNHAAVIVTGQRGIGKGAD